MITPYFLYPRRVLFCSILSALAILCSFNLHAQNIKHWDKTFGGNNYEELHSLQQTSDGGYILGGYSESDASGDKTQNAKGGKDYWVIKLDAGGNLIWEKTIGGAGDDYLYAVKQTSDGGYILGGSSDSGIGGDKTEASRGTHDYWVVKLDASGNKLWDKTFGGTSTDVLLTLQQTSDGGYILGGGSESGIGGNKTQSSRGANDLWIIKIDPSGNKVWDKSFGGSGVDYFSGLQQTSDGGFILGSTSNSGAGGDKSQSYHGLQGNSDYWVVKLNATGTKVWDRRFGGTGVETLNSIRQTSDGGYILGGDSESGISGDKTEGSRGIVDFWVVKLSSSGSILWEKTLGGNLADQLYSLQQTSDGGYILGGASDSDAGLDKSQPNKGDMDFWLVKINWIGTKTWDKTFGGNSHDRLFALQQTTDSGFIFGGFSGSGISGDKSQPSKGVWDYWVIKTGLNPNGIKEDSNSDISVFPNPNNGKFNLQLSNLASSTGAITVADLLGRVVLQQEFQTTSKQLIKELIIPSAKGMYFLKVKAGNQTSTKKIIVN